MRVVILNLDTICKFRTAYSNHVKTTPQANLQVMAFGEDKGYSQRASQDKCFSLWFTRFLRVASEEWVKIGAPIKV
jgi:hypothetical protein